MENSALTTNAAQAPSRALPQGFAIRDAEIERLKGLLGNVSLMPE